MVKGPLRRWRLTTKNTKDTKMSGVDKKEHHARKRARGSLGWSTNKEGLTIWLTDSGYRIGAHALSLSPGRLLREEDGRAQSASHVINGVFSS